MYGKSPMTKALVGKQNNLPAELKAKIMAAPESPTKMYGKKSPAKKYKSDAQRKAVHASKADKGSPAKKYGKSPMKAEMPDDVKNLTKTNYKKDTKKKSGPDWSTAPKNNTQARRDWYTKNNLAQDATTKLKPKPPKKEATIKAPNTKKSLTTTTKSKLAVDGKSKKDVMKGKRTLGDTRLGNVKVGKNGKRLAETRVGKAFSKGRAKGIAARQARAERMKLAKAERIAKRKDRKNKK